MAQNIHRLTASRILLVFAVALFLASLVALQIRMRRSSLEWVEYTTGLGDPDLYLGATAGILGTNDFFQPNLRFAEFPDGIYRRNHDPQNRADADMLSLGREASDRFTVYTPRDRKESRILPVDEDARRYFLKSGEDLYIEFGDRKYWEEYQAPDGSAVE